MWTGTYQYNTALYRANHHGFRYRTTMKKLFPSKHLLSFVVHLWALLHSCPSLIFKQFKSCSISPFYHGRWSGFYKYYYSRFKLTTVEIFEQTPVNQQRFWRFRNDEIRYCFTLASGASPIIANNQSCKAQSRTLIPIFGVLLHARYVSKVALDIATGPRLTAICSNETVKFVHVEKLFKSNSAKIGVMAATVVMLVTTSPQHLLYTHLNCDTDPTFTQNLP